MSNPLFNLPGVLTGLLVLFLIAVCAYLAQPRFKAFVDAYAHDYVVWRDRGILAKYEKLGYIKVMRTP